MESTNILDMAFMCIHEMDRGNLPQSVQIFQFTYLFTFIYYYFFLNIHFKLFFSYGSNLLPVACNQAQRGQPFVCFWKLEPTPTLRVKKETGRSTTFLDGRKRERLTNRRASFGTWAHVDQLNILGKTHLHVYKNIR